ncbi:MAG: hypothetical protein ACFCUU_12885 [Cyclobacteriaceae bacterium]
MLYSLILLFFIMSGTNNPDKTRFLEYENSQVLTTYQAPDIFYGTYKGARQGFLTLNADGTGIYKYDYPVPGPDGCLEEEIAFIWGFIVDDAGKLVKFEREYGLSYPVIFSAEGNRGFQGCTKKAIIDYIQHRKDGSMHVSSSDDWKK